MVMTLAVRINQKGEKWPKVITRVIAFGHFLPVLKIDWPLFAKKWPLQCVAWRGDMDDNDDYTQKNGMNVD